MSKQTSPTQSSTAAAAARSGRGGFGAAKPPAKKAIFNAAAVAARLSTLRAAAAETLRARAISEGKAAAAAAGQDFDESTVEVTEDEIAATRWWAPALKFEWSSLRKGNNGTQWVSNEYRDEQGVAGPLVVRINGERHTGQIMPITDEGVAELTAKSKSSKTVIKKRDKKPAIQVQKWFVQVKTLEDGITVATDEAGRPMLPGDDKRSMYYQVAEHVNEAFVTEANERIARGIELLTLAKAEKIAQKSNAKVQSVIDAYVAKHGPITPGSMIIGGQELSELRKHFPTPKDQEALLRGALQASNTRVAQLIQRTIGESSDKNRGLPLPNPMTRVAMNFDQTTGMAQMSFFDKDKPFEAKGKKQYDVGKIDDEPICDENIHKFVLPRATVDGIVNMDSICFSNMGISMPVKADILVVEKPKGRDTSLADVYEDETPPEGEPGEGEGGAEAVAPQPTAPAKSAAPPAKPAAARPAAAKSAPKSDEPTDQNYDDLLQNLSA